MTVLYLLFGFPGAGKTTTAKLIEKLTGATRLSSDEVRLQLFPNPTFSKQEHTMLYKHLNTRCRELLANHKSVVYDANLNRLEHRQEKYQIADDLGVKTILVWVKTKRELAKDRAVNQERSRFVPKHETAIQMFDRIADAIEQPGPDEQAVLLDGINISEQRLKDALNKAST